MCQDLDFAITLSQLKKPTSFQEPWVRASTEVGKSGQDRVYLILGVDMQETDAGQPALVQETEPLHGLDGVVVTRPDRHPPATKLLGYLSCAQAVDFYRESGYPAL